MQYIKIKDTKYGELRMSPKALEKYTLESTKGSDETSIHKGILSEVKLNMEKFGISGQNGIKFKVNSDDTLSLVLNIDSKINNNIIDSSKKLQKEISEVIEKSLEIDVKEINIIVDDIKK